ncbi:MAG: hypothetical protein ACRENG_21155, partial [bacterium]
THQIIAENYLDFLFKQSNSIKQVMDLGCGAGDSIDYFRKIAPNARWIGLDIQKSQQSKREKERMASSILLTAFIYRSTATTLTWFIVIKF